VFAFVEREKTHHAVAVLCRVLGSSTSGYYAWRSRAPSARARDYRVLADRIVQIHQQSRLTYVAPRTTQREPTARPAADHLERQFTATAPNHLWAADITYVPTWAGFLYLTVVLDVSSRRIVGWAMADHLRTELVVSALEMALWNRRPDAGVIHHADQGSQYTSLAFGQRCQTAGVVPSMGSRSDCYANVITEALFATLECALLRRHILRTHTAARTALFDDVEGFSNRQRRHSALGYRSPVAYERETPLEIAA
jgi:putative transposase